MDTEIQTQIPEARWQRTGKSGRRWHKLVHWPLATLGALLLLLIWGSVLHENERIRRDQFTQHEVELASLTHTFDAMLERQVQNIDNTLRAVRTEFAAHARKMAHLTDLIRHGPLHGMGGHIAIVDRHGRVRHVDLDPEQGALAPIDPSAVGYFASGGKDMLHIAEPKPAAAQGVPALLQLSRPIYSPNNGRLNGLVLAQLRADALTTYIASLHIEHDTVVTIVSGNGSILSRSAAAEEYFGRKLPPALLGHFYHHGDDTHIETDLLEHQGMSFSHRWLENYPLLVLVSRPARHVHESIAAQQRQIQWLGAGSSLIVAVALIITGRSLRRRQVAEYRLARERAHLVQAQSIARLASWEINWITGDSYVSGEMQRMLGLERRPSSFSIDALLDRVHAEDRQQVADELFDALNQGRSGQLIHRLVTSDGELRWIRTQWNSTLGPQGQPVKTSGTLLDITERQNDMAAREALTRERMLLLESTGEGLVGLDTAGRCTFANRAAGEMLRYPVDALIGAHFATLVQPRRAAAPTGTTSPFHAAYSSGQPSHHEDEVFQRQDGQSLPVDYQVHPIVDAGVLQGAVVSFSDITERKQHETAMRIADQAFEATREGMFVTDGQPVILRVNQAFTQITGYTAEDAVGQFPSFRSSGQHDEAFYHAMWERLRAQGHWQGEILNRRKNGEIYPESVTISAVVDHHGKATHYVATLRDITQSKAAEEEIRRLAFFDPLTQLPNRRLLEDRLSQGMAASERKGRHGAVMFMDLDKFKQLNDTLGHDMGDLLLQQIALRLKDAVRRSDTVARLGGDEFVVLLLDLHSDPERAREQCQLIGDKILSTLNQPYDLKGRPYGSTPSIGVALFFGRSQATQTLIKQADLAMYQAKAAGRNQLHFFDPEVLSVPLDPHAGKPAGGAR